MFIIYGLIIPIRTRMFILTLIRILILICILILILIAKRILKERFCATFEPQCTLAWNRLTLAGKRLIPCQSLAWYHFGGESKTLVGNR